MATGLRWDQGRISDDARKLLKDKTGFEGYTAYLEDYNKKDSGYEQLLKSWRQMPHDIPPKFERTNSRPCDILDLITDENSSLRLSWSCQTSSNSQIFRALSEPRKDVYARIVSWHIPRSSLMYSEFLEDLGLALNIRPNFVKSLYAKSYPDSFGFTHIPDLVANHVMVGDRVATMTRCCISERSSVVPIVFIADTSDRYLDPIWIKWSKLEVSSLELPWRSDRTFYGEILMGIIERNSVFSTDADALMLPAVLADMHMNAYNLRSWCDYTPPRGKTHRIEDSVEAKTIYGNVLRRKLEDVEDDMQDALAGLSSLYGTEWSRKYGLESTVEYSTQSINRARRFEATLRDSCQVENGQLSLEESKKSIELSMSQIEEVKRGELYVNCIRELPLIDPSQDM